MSRKREETPGYIYVLTNPKMPGLVKIGQTSRDAQARAAEISAHESVPVPFEIAYSCHTYWPASTERLIHRSLARYRVSRRREFFQLPVDLATEVCRRSTLKGGRDQFRRWVKSEVKAPRPTIGENSFSLTKKFAVGAFYALISVSAVIYILNNHFVY